MRRPLAVAALATCTALGAFTAAPISPAGADSHAGPVDFEITITNVGPEGLLDTPRAGGTVPISPGVVAVYNGARNPLFTVGEKANAGTKLVAEDGVTSVLADRAAGLNRVTDSGVFSTEDGPIAPALFSGTDATIIVSAMPGQALSLEAMMVQSNDWFFGIEDLNLFHADGMPVSGDVTSHVGLYDAGSEADTAPGTGDFQKPVQDPAATNFGPGENHVIMSAYATGDGFEIPAVSDMIRVEISPVGTTPPPPVVTGFELTVHNIAPEGLLDTPRAGGTVPISPGVAAVYNGARNPLFTPGEKANAGTKLVAEDGVTGVLADRAASLARVTDFGVFSTEDGPIAPALFLGTSATIMLDADPGQRLSLEAMMVQSNDWFYGINGLSLFDALGNPVHGDITSHVGLYDAGSEADTAPGTGDFQKPVQDPAATNFGPGENEPIISAYMTGDGFEIPAVADMIRVEITPIYGDHGEV